MDDVITLIKETVTGHDSNGNEIIQRTERELFCSVFGVTRSEFYRAATVGLRPELTVRLTEYTDYEDEEIARYDGTYYTVIRTYRNLGSSSTRLSGNDPRLGLNSIELVLAKRIGDAENAAESE